MWPCSLVVCGPPLGGPQLCWLDGAIRTVYATEPLRPDEAVCLCWGASPLYQLSPRRYRHPARPFSLGHIRTVARGDLLKIVDKLRCRVDPRHKKPIAGACARHVEQVALRVVDLFEIGFVDDAIDPGLKREDLVVATSDDYSPELEALGEVHGSGRDGSDCSAWALAQSHSGKSGILNALDGPVQLGLGPDEYARSPVADIPRLAVPSASQQCKPTPPQAIRESSQADPDR